MTTRPGGFLNVPAGADLSEKQNYLVKLSSGEAVLASAATDVVIGVLTNNPEENDTATIQGLHSSETGKVKTGSGGGTAGAFLTSDADGKAIATTTATHRVFGIALRDWAAGDVIEFIPTFHIID